MPEPVTVRPCEQHRGQIEAVLWAWGMPEANPAEIADLMFRADLHGIDSPGMSMLPHYDIWRRQGRLNLACVPRESPVSAIAAAAGAPWLLG